MHTLTPKDLANPWPDKLKALRKARSWTQVEAAEAIGCSTATWVAWERGRQKPYRKTQKRLQQIFGISVEVANKVAKVV